MDFTVSEELTSVKDLARQIFTDFTADDKLRAIEQQEQRFDPGLWQAMAEAGLLGLDIEQAHGGTDLGFFALSALCEEAGRTVAPAPVVPVLVSAAATLRRYGRARQKEAWLTGIATGELQLSAALEEYANDDPARPAASAAQTDSGYAISGTKICVSRATTARRILLSARCGEELVVALVDPEAAGITLTPQTVTSGETLHQLAMNAVQVPDEDIVAVGNKALRAMHWAQQATRTALCAMTVGLTDKMMRMTGSYTTEREQFGRPIATFQAVSHRVADCYIDVECLRLVTEQAASLLDQGRPAGEATLIAKIWCGDTAHRVSQASQHCHGGTGVDRDYPLHRYCLQARQIEMSLGNSARLSAQLGSRIAAEYLATASQS
ncbi:acyl-CoA dehydrogenase [Seongchinamella sediminis]|uniref:Acyl-CoA dehydrogenase n=1 Tax=Seongchinamella sediminis TaxID=2283635 RepID=A0A3L7E0M2_9GAMM|nr:acyl-CoA dehydrogenase family protein [Seongchinamella sediminis]RLQ23328.1 acyl-CoA dehydrogenase [Seongchinamella sediminis]